MRVDGALERGITTRPLAVVHVGQSAIVLRDEARRTSVNTLLVLTSEASGLMPGGICLDATDFSGVRNEIGSREPAGCEVVLDGWNDRSSSVEPVDLRLHHIDRSWDSALGFAQVLRRASQSEPARSVMSPEPIRRLAPGLAHQAVGGRVRTETLRAMVGAGPGTTPSGDDVIVGVLAGLRVLGLRDQSASLCRRVTGLIGATTVASRHYLSAATEGRFGEHVHQLVAALADEDPPERTLTRAASWGATSGTDLLVGLVATLATSVTNASIESAA